MAEQLTYVAINPYTLRKSRTGGILNRLLTRTSLDLVDARLFAPSKELVRDYSARLQKTFNPRSQSHKDQARRLICEYVRKHYSPDPATGKRHRVLVLLLKGENAVAKVHDCVGDISHRSVTGESIRDTYGDYVRENGEVKYFEPAVLTPPTVQEARGDLKIWAKYSERDGGLLQNILPYKRTKDTQRALVIIKPDNFMFPSGKPGNVMDMFSKTGLYIVCFKVNRMTVAQAEQFYGPVLPILREKFKEISAGRAREALSREFGFTLPENTARDLGEIVGPRYADAQFSDIVKFMSGRKPSECSPSQKKQPGTVKSVVIVYEGENAVAKVREVLGPTDPRKAPPGSIRREFGQNIMVNAAHASDSPENARREMRILSVSENSFKRTVLQFYPA